jgi:hypothetical protein
MKRLSGIFSAPKTSFQILSDLYLNHESQYLTFHIPVSAPYLILAGNIGKLIDYEAYLSFLIRRCNLYERVYLVLGSLEYHGISVRDGLELAAKMEQEAGVRGRLVVLDRKRSDVPGTNVTLLGCTLWSHIPAAAESAVLKKIPEFDQQGGIKNWSISAHNAAHAEELKWLKQEITGPSNFAGSLASSSGSSTQLVVVSAFAPDLKQALDPWQVDSPWSCAYGSNLLGGDEWKGVSKWVCGSTGRTTEFKVNGTKVVVNQRGCVGEEVKGILQDGISDKEKKGLFDVTKVVKV